MDKKGQIGATLNWVGAVVIIMFIMFIFLLVTGWLAKDKSNQINIGGGGNLVALETFNFFMNSPVKDVCPHSYMAFEEATDSQNSKRSCKRDEIMKWCFLEISEDISFISDLQARPEFTACLNEYFDKVEEAEGLERVRLSFRWGVSSKIVHLFGGLPFQGKSDKISRDFYLNERVMVDWEVG